MVENAYKYGNPLTISQQREVVNVITQVSPSVNDIIEGLSNNEYYRYCFNFFFFIL
jgi:hypothetical protein